MKVNYLSLGTFEFLVNPNTSEYYFLEVNPRIQVEHTITECITSTDIVTIQLLLAQGASLSSVGLPEVQSDPAVLPSQCSIQLRLTAENVRNNWSLSIGKIQSFQLPSGNGVRVDTHLLPGNPTVVSPDFDSLLAKIIITASSWEDVVAKARRALEDTKVDGVKTNIDILRGIVASADFVARRCDTSWLEANHEGLLQTGERISATRSSYSSLSTQKTASTLPTGASANSSTLFRKGDAWTIELSPLDQTSPERSSHHLQINRVLRNDFPSSLSAEIAYSNSSSTEQTALKMELASTSASAAATSSKLKRGDASDSSHVLIPFPGKLVEVLVDEGDLIKEGDVVCVVQQMKMELEVRSSRRGRVKWLFDAEEGEEVGEGVLAAVLETDAEAKL